MAGSVTEWREESEARSAVRAVNIQRREEPIPVAATARRACSGVRGAVCVRK